MRNYPNMSYCMFENTLGAMAQVNEFLIEADEDDVLDISRDELRAMRDLVGYCEQFMREVAEFEDKRQEALASQIEEAEDA